VEVLVPRDLQTLDQWIFADSERANGSRQMLGGVAQAHVCRHPLIPRQLCGQQGDHHTFGGTMDYEAGFQ
jgi:hypothetical protein